MLVVLWLINMDCEWDKFFQFYYIYNLQFEYQEFMFIVVLEKYCEVFGQFIYQVVGIIEVVLEKFGIYEYFEVVIGGQLFIKCQIWFIVCKYMQKEGCVGEVVVQLSEDLLFQVVMMVENSWFILVINLIGVCQYWLEGMLWYEIGIYYLWGVNNVCQLWYNVEGWLWYGLWLVNFMEEGLVSLYSVLFCKQLFLWCVVLFYYIIYCVVCMFFCQFFQDLVCYVQDVDVCWEYCVCVKCGQIDILLLGCFSKDQVYLDGIVCIL